MALDFRVLGTADEDAIYAFAYARLAEAIDDSPERELASWEVPWRREALAYYIPLGWSFAATEEGKLLGFFLAQPFLFMRGQTQTLWIEHVEAVDSVATDALIDLATRAARDKHLQRALYADLTHALPGFNASAAPSAQALRESLARRGARALGQGLYEIRTTKG